MKRENIVGRANVEDTPELEAYYRALEGEELGALWNVANEIEPWYPQPKSVPIIWKWKKVEHFERAMSQYVRETLREGLFGWQVRDCVVTMTDSNYSSPDGPQATRGPLSTAADFRKLTPLVLMSALKQADTVVCEPLHRFPAFTASVCNLRPTSRGVVNIRSADPGAAPLIAPNYLATEED
jgi:translation elongation factor EF-G